MATRSAQIRDRTRRDYDQQARTIGHPDMAALLTATAHLTDRDLAALLGVAPSTAGRIRHLYGRPHPDPTAVRAQRIRHSTYRTYDTRAREAGYHGITHLLTVTGHLADADIADLLYTSIQTANRLRRDPRMHDPTYLQSRSR
jgi:hypothetical protein